MKMGNQGHRQQSLNSRRLRMFFAQKSQKLQRPDIELECQAGALPVFRGAPCCLPPRSAESLIHRANCRRVTGRNNN